MGFSSLFVRSLRQRSYPYILCHSTSPSHMLEICWYSRLPAILICAWVATVSQHFFSAGTFGLGSVFGWWWLGLWSKWQWLSLSCASCNAVPRHILCVQCAEETLLANEISCHVGLERFHRAHAPLPPVPFHRHFSCSPQTQFEMLRRHWCSVMAAPAHTHGRSDRTEAAHTGTPTTPTAIDYFTQRMATEENSYRGRSIWQNFPLPLCGKASMFVHPHRGWCVGTVTASELPLISTTLCLPQQRPNHAACMPVFVPVSACMCVCVWVSESPSCWTMWQNGRVDPY